MSNSLDLDQDGYFVELDLGPNYLQRLSADDKVAASRQRVIGRRNNLHHNAIFLQWATRPTVTAPDRGSSLFFVVCLFSCFLFVVVYIFTCIKPYYRWFKDA